MEANSRFPWPDLVQTAPAIKDTVMVPARGDVVVRLRTDNPGFWFLHCHQQQHLVDGMALLLQVRAIHEPGIVFITP